MDLLWISLSLICFIAFAGLGLFAVYTLVMGGIQNDRDQVVFGLKGLLGAVVAAIGFFLLFIYVFHPGVC